MAPGAKKNPKAKSKKALAVDFKKVKSKVGRKLAPPQNATKVEFKSKGIVIPGQSVVQNKDGLAVNQRKQTLKELLVQTSHYSERVRKDAIMGLKDLFGKHPKELVMHAVVVIERISPRITDIEKSVRQALVVLLRSSTLPNLPQTMMRPLVPVIMAHICSAMTHLVLDIRVAACTFSDLLVQHCPTLVIPFFSGQIVQHYVGLLGKGGISGQPGSRLTGVLSSLEHFLSALKQSTITQPSRDSLASNVTHKWGLKFDISNQGGIEGLHALHGYKSGFPLLHLSAQEGAVHHQFKETSSSNDGQSTKLANQRVQNSGRLEQIMYSSRQLVPVLLECWAEYAPVVCNDHNPDATSLGCMVFITRCLCHIFQTLARESAAGSSSRDMNTNTSAIHVPEYGSEEWEAYMHMRQEFLPGLHKRLLNNFPVPAPEVRLLPKVEEGLVALNVGICEVMLQFILPDSEQMSNCLLDGVLQYFEDVLYGLILPSSQFSEGLSNPKLAEPHVKSLITYLPGLLKCVSSDWATRLLQAFTHVFESCNSCSNTKMICLAAMTELVLPGSKSTERNKGKHSVVASEFQTQWLQSLPKLLWELKHSHSNVSQAVLEMLLYIGRSSPEGSSLSEKYSGLQQAMVPFFCTFVPSKQSDESRCVYGPFIKLPKPCQELAIDLLYYYTSFSPLFLKVLAHCCLCSDLDVAVSVRTVEVLQKAFCRGSISLTEHLSFLFTLLAGHISRAGSSTKESSTEIDGGEPSDYHEDLDLAIRERHSAISGVVCACLSQLGDGNLVLFLLGPSIQEELGKKPQLRVIHGLFRAVAVLSHRDKRSDELFLPDVLQTVLPTYVANFLVILAEMNAGFGACGNGPMLTSLKRPCIILMARSTSFTRSVLNVIYESLQKDVHLLSLRHWKQRVAFAQVVLDMIKTEKLDSCLSPSREVIKAIMQTFKVQEDVHTCEGRELKRLHEQLQTVTNAVFGNEFSSKTCTKSTTSQPV